MGRGWLAAACLLVLAACEKPVTLDGETLESPDGQLVLTAGLLPGGSPAYRLDRAGTAVVLPSRLGFDLTDGTSLTDGFSVEGVERSSFDETWAPVWGEEDSIRNHYNELLVKLSRADGVRMDLRFRLFDDGLGFRYEFPLENKLTYFNIREERTEFAMAGDHTAWWISGDYDTQEFNYTESRLREIRGISASMRLANASTTGFSPTGVQTALQMKTADGLYINLHEAAVVDYPTTNLDHDDRRLVFRTWLTPDAEGYLIFAPSTSPENCFRKDGRAVAVSLTTAMTMEIIARLFADLKDAGNVLRGAGDTVDEVLLRKAAEAQEKLLPIRLTDDGRIYEWYENPPEEEPHHRHVSPLYALFPAHLIDKDEMPDLAEACKEFLTHRGDAGTGWSLGWKINLWAVLGDGDHALRLLDMQLSPRGMRGAPKDGGGTYPNLFDAHPPFQIDGNFGAGAGILNLLVREANGKITLLPALPAEWKNGSVRGLRLKGGKKADFSWRNGKLTESRIYDAP